MKAIVPDHISSLIQYCERMALTKNESFSFSNCDFGNVHYNYGRMLTKLRLYLRNFYMSPAVATLEAIEYFRASNGEWLLGNGWNYYRTNYDIIKYLTAEIMAATKLRNRGNTYVRRYPDAYAIAEQAINCAKLSKDRQAPFFIWAHFFDAHIPYSPGCGANWQRDAARLLREIGISRPVDAAVSMRPSRSFVGTPFGSHEWDDWIGLYDAGLRSVDSAVGRIVEHLSMMGLHNTIVVVMADHGEEFGEHGYASHNYKLYDHNTRIPLVFSHPDITSGIRVPFASNLDIAPTIADLVGIAHPTGWEGRSINDSSIGDDDTVLLESFFGSPCDFETRPISIAARKGNLKLICKSATNGEEDNNSRLVEAYNVEADPYEQDNLIGQCNSTDILKLLPIIEERLHQLPVPMARNILKEWTSIVRGEYVHA